MEDIKTIFKAILIGLLLVGAGVCYGQNMPVQLKSGWDQPGGLNTSKPGHLIPENDFTDLGDVFTDNGPYVEKRGGLTTLYTTGKSFPVNQIYENIKLDGNRYAIIKSSNEIGYIGPSETYVTLLSTLSTTSRLWMVQYNNLCYIGTSGKDDRWLFTGSGLQISTYTPCSKYPIIYMDKMFAINISTPRANETQITTSGDESVIRYSRIGDLKEWDGDFWIGVNRNDGDTITGSFVYRGNLYVTKTNSVHQIVRVDNEDNTDGERAVPVLSNIGCISQDSIKEVNGVMYWVSNQGVIEFNGTSYKIVSEDIKDDINVFINNTALATNSFTDTTLIDFGAGTCVNVDTTTIITLGRAGNVVNQQNVVNTSGYSSSGANFNFYQKFRTSYTVVIDTIAVYGHRHTDTSQNLLFSFDAGGVSISHRIPVTGVGVSSQWITLDISTYNVVLTSGTEYTLTWKAFTDAAGYRFMYDSGDTYPRGTGYVNNTPFPLTEIGDFAFKVYGRQYSPNRFGSFTSQKREISSWKQWSTFEANFNACNKGNIKWFVSVATASAICSTDTLTAVTTGFTIASAAGPWIIWYASMTTTDVVESPIIGEFRNVGSPINAVKVNYFYDTGISFVSLFGYSNQNDLRYWLTGQRNSSQVNDTIFVYQQRNGKWTKLDIGVNCIADFKGNLLLGDSNPTGKIFKYSGTYASDNGTAISPYVRTKDYVLSTRMTDNKVNEIWAYVEPSTNYSTMTITYFPNMKDTAWTLYSDVGLSAVTGYQDMFIKKKLVVRDLDRIRTLGVKFTNFDKLMGFDLLFTTYPPGER